MRYNMFLGLALGAAVLSACVDAGTTQASGLDRRVTVVNNAFVTIEELYVSSSGGTVRNDILRDDVIPPGETASFNLDDGSGDCDFDFHAFFADGTSSSSTGVDICRYSTVTIN